MNNIVSNGIIQAILLSLLFLGGAYFLGKFFTKGMLHEIDNYFDKKFDKLNPKKQKKDGNEEENEKEEFFRGKSK